MKRRLHYMTQTVTTDEGTVSWETPMMSQPGITDLPEGKPYAYQEAGDPDAEIIFLEEPLPFWPVGKFLKGKPPSDEAKPEIPPKAPQHEGQKDTSFVYASYTIERMQEPDDMYTEEEIIGDGLSEEDEAKMRRDLQRGDIIVLHLFARARITFHTACGGSIAHSVKVITPGLWGITVNNPPLPKRH